MPGRPKAFRLRAPDPAEAEVRTSARDRGYTAAWDKASAAHGREHPLCGYCAIGAFGPVARRPRTCTDHLYPQRRYPGIFWRREFWVSACTPCHSVGKQQAERQGRAALDDLARRLGLDPYEGPEPGGRGG